MHENMRASLNAYLDGELHGTRLREIKLHLASCESCRNELKELRIVSGLLQAVPAPQFMPAERFASNLTLSLPRRTQRDLPPKPGSLAWWLVPAGLLAAWFFVRTVFTLTGVVTTVQMTGLIGQAANWLGGGQEAAWSGRRGSAHAFPAECTGRLRCEPLGRVPLAGADCFALLGLVVCLVVLPPAAAHEYRKREINSERKGEIS